MQYAEAVVVVYMNIKIVLLVEEKKTTKKKVIFSFVYYHIKELLPGCETKEQHESVSVLFFSSLRF